MRALPESEGRGKRGKGLAIVTAEELQANPFPLAPVSGSSVRFPRFPTILLAGETLRRGCFRWNPRRSLRNGLLHVAGAIELCIQVLYDELVLAAEWNRLIAEDPASAHLLVCR